MKILIACEYSGVVREAFRSIGHDAISCDLLESEQPGPHITGDVFDVITSDNWDMMIAHPPCTYLCSSGLHWNTRQHVVDGEKCYTPAAIERKKQTELALKFITDLWNCGIPKIAIENPVGCINTRLPFMPKPQYVQPYNYGHDASKKTGFWTKNLPVLRYYEEDYIEPRIVEIGSRKYNRWANQTLRGQDSTSPGKDRGKDRAKTYEGIAYAMVEAWG